jgi:hypothetical protein
MTDHYKLLSDPSDHCEGIRYQSDDLSIERSGRWAEAISSLPQTFREIVM